jgi:hypothetical protein
MLLTLLLVCELSFNPRNPRKSRRIFLVVAREGDVHTLDREPRERGI